MVKLATLPDPRARLDAAERRLAELRERHATSLHTGDELRQEHWLLDERLPRLALERLAGEISVEELNATRARHRAMPDLIAAAAVERDGLEREIAEAEAECVETRAETARSDVHAMIARRAALAPEIDATLAHLAAQWREYRTHAGTLDAALGVLGFEAGAIGDGDKWRLQIAVQHAGADLALAVGQPPPMRWVPGDMKSVPDLSRWDGATPLADVDDAERIKGKLAGSPLQRMLTRAMKDTA